MKRRPPDFFIIGFFAVASALLLGVGCGQKESSSGSTATRPSASTHAPVQSSAFQIPKETPQNARNFISRIQVVCDESNHDCHPSVAMLGAVHSMGAEVCTAFLIKPNQVLTNSHCVPVALKGPGSSCAGEIQLVFGDQKRVGCSRIIVDSKYQRSEAIQDYAIIELAESLNDRQPFIVSDEGIDDETELTVIQVDPAPEVRSNEGYFFGKMRRQTCESMMDHLFNPIYQSRYSVDVSIKGCDLRPGNSGSPLIDSRGRIRGLVNRIFTPTVIERASTQNSNPSIRTRAQSAGATNLACIKELFPASIKRPECNPTVRDFFPRDPEEQEVKDFQHTEDPKRRQELSDLFAERVIDKSEELLVERKTQVELNTASDLVRFSALQKAEPFGYTAEIRCYLPSAETILRQKSEIEIDYPTLRISRDAVDDYGRLQTSVEIRYVRRSLRVVAQDSSPGGAIQIGDYQVGPCQK